MLPRCRRERNPKVLAQLARRTMRAKISVLEEAFTGQFTGHHALLLSAMLDRSMRSVPTSPRSMPRSRHAAPFATVPSSMRSPASAWPPRYVILAEIGTDMTRFPTAGHLVSWPGYASHQESAGKKKGKSSPGTATPTWPPFSATPPRRRQDRHLPRRAYRRIARRRGSKRAIVA